MSPELEFCGYVAQVKTSTAADGTTPPKRLLGAAWGPQSKRMEAGIYIPLYLVLVTPKQDRFSIHYLSADLQAKELFVERTPLGVNARRAGWQGFYYDLGIAGVRLIPVVEGQLPAKRVRRGVASGEPGA